MPKTIFKVTDSTGLNAAWEESHVVYIPVASKYDSEADPEQVAVAPVLYTNKSALEDDSANFDVKDEGYKAAHYLLEIGLPVLVEGVLTTDDGTAEGTILDPEGETLAFPVIDWTRLEDKNLYDIKFITSGKWDSIIVIDAQTSYTTLAVAMNNLAETRKDCVALINVNKNLTKVADIRKCVDTPISSKNIDWERAACFVPAVRISNDIFKDETTKELDWIHGTWDYLGAYAYAIRNNPSWYAMAGSFRGINPDVAEVKVKFNLSDIEVLQARSKTTEVDLDEAGDNIGVAINPVAVINPYGILVWGNRTLKDNKGVEGGTVGVLKASSFLNIENMVATINKRLYRVANKYRFEPNNDVLWFNLQADITPLLDQMKSGNGLLAYKLERIPTDKRARIKVRVTLVPIEAVEDFVFEVDLTDFIGPLA